MFKKLIFEIAVTFIIRQIIKYSESIDFELVREDLRELVRKTVPYTAFDDEAVAFVDTIIDGILFLVQNLEIAGVLEALKNNDIPAAMQILKDLLKRYLD